jgi:hypothetical protein
MQSRRVGVEAIDDVVDEAVGRRHRPGPVVGRTAGPAGNAQLTAWTGLLLLALVAVELVTLVDVRGLARRAARTSAGRAVRALASDGMTAAARSAP